LRGAVIGTIAFVLLKEFYSSEAILGSLAHRWQLTLGLTMIFLVATLPNGLIGLGERIRRIFSWKRPTAFRTETSRTEAGVEQ
jgi:branched-chain amino acid transport system permease protein